MAGLLPGNSAAQVVHFFTKQYNLVLAKRWNSAAGKVNPGPGRK